MNWGAINFDWNHLRAFLATAEQGSLSAAARALEVTQPTLSRQVSALEAELGVTLFERGTRSMTLTQAGLDLLDHARAMGEVAMKVSLAASGQAQDLTGRVVIASTEMVAAYHLPDIVQTIITQAPGLHIELSAANEIQNLIRREADIAIRHARPDQAELVARSFGEDVAHIYGARALLDRQPELFQREALSQARFIGIDPVERYMPDLSPWGVSIEPSQFMITSASSAARMQMVRKGLGLSFIPKSAADQFDDLVPILPEEVAIAIPVWLVTHKELWTSKRIRLVFDVISEALSRRGTRMGG